jgi:hypothetical protein
MNELNHFSYVLHVNWVPQFLCKIVQVPSANPFSFSIDIFCLLSGTVPNIVYSVVLHTNKALNIFPDAKSPLFLAHFAVDPGAANEYKCILTIV